MGSRITYSGSNIPDLKMSNSLTAAFHAAMALSLSPLASTSNEKELAIWFCCRDYVTFGSGAVGFDLGDIPWKKDTFAHDRPFLMKAIDEALNKFGWQFIINCINPELVENALVGFRELVANFEFDEDPNARHQEWENPTSKDKCITHNTYLHWDGCIVCAFLKDFVEGKA